MARMQESTTRTVTNDPLRLCIYTTVALLAWLLGPLAVLLFSGLGVWAYTRARRQGLLRSRCILGDTRLTITYLGLAFVLAALFVARNVTSLG
jgi:hypothetical protein